MKKINWRIRFTMQNKTFITRFVISVIVPVLVYYGIKAEDLTTWKSIFDLIVKAISNPFVVGTMIVNAINIIPDPTTQGLGDSVKALQYNEPKSKGEHRIVK